MDVKAGNDSIPVHRNEVLNLNSKLTKLCPEYEEKDRKFAPALAFFILPVEKLTDFI
jgi:hypothetical protein